MKRRPIESYLCSSVAIFCLSFLAGCPSIEDQSGPMGACCEGEQCSVETETVCNARTGTYLGDNSTCEQAECEVGACCDGNLCELTGRADCEFDEREFLGNGTTCQDDPCAPSQGACCFPDGSCENEFEQAACEEDGGVHQGEGSDCDGTNCPDLFGACCDGVDCTETLEDSCEAQFLGAGTNCTDDACVGDGACCDGEICTISGQADCEFDGNTFLGEGTSCESDSCATESLQITDLTYNQTVTVNQPDTGNMMISFSGQAVFPVTIIFRQVESDQCGFGQGACAPLLAIVEEEQNPIPFPNAPACENAQTDTPDDLPASLSYEVVIEDSSGQESDPVPAPWTCAPG